MNMSLALSILGALTPHTALPQSAPLGIDGLPRAQVHKGGKGQKRNARPKPSGVAAMKRAAKKRNNIRKHK